MPAEHTDSSFHDIYNSVHKLGLPINNKKVVAPSDDMVCMGIYINAKNNTISIPGEKMREIMFLISQFKGVRTVS